MEKGDLVQLKGACPYHQRRKEIHGALYIVKRLTALPLVEARSIATGVLLTLDAHELEKAPKDDQET